MRLTKQEERELQEQFKAYSKSELNALMQEAEADPSYDSNSWNTTYIQPSL